MSGMILNLRLGSGLGRGQETWIGQAGLRAHQDGIIAWQLRAGRLGSIRWHQHHVDGMNDAVIGR